MNKNFRHGQILKIIRSKKIHTQEELARELRELGIQATQVTLSRDIRELRLAKTPDGYQQMPPEQVGPQLGNMVREFMQDIKVAMNLVVVKTQPAHAGSVAVALDHESWDEVVGTLAGDDTILIITGSVEAAEQVQRRILAMLE